MTNTATTTTRRQRDVLRAAGYDDTEFPRPPKNGEQRKFTVGAGLLSAASDDLYEALDTAWQMYKVTEMPACVWDFRGDTAAYDPTATPLLLAVVGTFWVAD